VQLDVPVLLSDLCLALDHLRNQLSPLPVDLLDLPRLPLEPLPELPPLLPGLVQLPLHLLVDVHLPLEVPPGHTPRHLQLHLVQLGQLLVAPVVRLDRLLLQGLQLVTQPDQLLLLGDHSLLEGQGGVTLEVETLL
jgi:hypothetical protein